MIDYYKNLSLENLFYTDENGVLQEEEWRDIPTFVGKYQESNLGRTKSLSRIILRSGKYPFTSKEKILKIYITRKGYCAIMLSLNGNKSKHTIHGLVAMAFLGHVPCGFELVVNHKNEIKLDNRADNLEIITHYQNMLYSYRRKATKNNRLLGTHFNKKNRWVSGITINRKRIILGYFDTDIEASKYYEKALESICNGNENFEIKRNNKIETIQWKNYIT